MSLSLLVFAMLHAEDPTLSLVHLKRCSNILAVCSAFARWCFIFFILVVVYFLFNFCCGICTWEVTLFYIDTYSTKALTFSGISPLHSMNLLLLLLWIWSIILVENSSQRHPELGEGEGIEIILIWTCSFVATLGSLASLHPIDRNGDVYACWFVCQLHSKLMLAPLEFERGS